MSHLHLHHHHHQQQQQHPHHYPHRGGFSRGRGHGWNTWHGTQHGAKQRPRRPLNWSEPAPVEPASAETSILYATVSAYSGVLLQLNRITVNPVQIHESPSQASTLAFDDRQELLWCGDQYGRVCSFHSALLRRYTSYIGHPAEGGPVKQLLFHELGVLSLAPTSLHLSSRRGFAIWHLEEESMQDLRCMNFVGKEQNHLVVAGCQNGMLKIDVERGKILEILPTDREYTVMKSSKYICAATTRGTIDLIDPTDLKIVKTLTTSNIGISGMDAQNTYLVTCGWVNRPPGGPMPAVLANVYDLRSMVQLPPVPFHAGAAFVQLHPRMSTTCIVASQAGQLQVIDLVNHNAVVMKQINIPAYMSNMILAPTGEALAVSDSEGSIHLWGSPSKVQFSEYAAQALEWDDHLEPVPYIDVDSDVPFSTIGMPFYREPLLSIMSNSDTYETGYLPLRIDPAVLAKARPGEPGIWFPNPKTMRRNQVERIRLTDMDGASIAAPKFLSEKSRDSESSHSSHQGIENIQRALADTVLGKTTKTEVPAMYGNVEIKYSYYGVEDFDFGYYNKTRYSGLETHITSSYTNSLLQLLKFTPVIRNLALRHTASACLQDACLLCELGFLFDTLEKAEGKNCQATNFLKTFNILPQANRLGILEESSQGTSLTEMMQSACRFMLSRMIEEYRNIAPSDSSFENAVTIDALSSIRCVHCHNETIRPGGSCITDLVYPAFPLPTRIRQPIPSFSQVLKASIELHAQTRGWCDKCRRYQQLGTRKTVRQLPDILVLNAALKSKELTQYWAIPGWLPTSIGCFLENGKFFSFEGEDLRLHLQRGMHPLKLYDLVGFVADVHSGENQKSHLVSLINVASSEREPPDPVDWHLFNDFLVCKTTREEAMKCSSSWKLPSVLAYQIRSANNSVDDTWKSNLDVSLLYQPYSINNKAPEACRILDPATEAPTAGTLVAIDTEFVSLQQAEIEIKADGNREVVRPTRLGLARVSVVRGSGEDENLPFINDYITIQEEIVDYVTEFSGVAEGDLNPQDSTHPLVPLKLAYKKLWLLLNLGCIFVGHGLSKDFRTINIHVPKAQTIDTVDCFYRKDLLRKLSLRFLVWYFLKDQVQTGNHDSIEDAVSALRLWRKYEEFKDAGIEEAMIDEVYSEGRKWGYKPPWESAAKSTSRRADLRNTDGSSSMAGSMMGANGRETPDLLAAGSGPGTPSGKRAVLSRGSEYFDSPLR